MTPVPVYPNVASEPETGTTIEITGNNLTIDDVVQASLYNVKTCLSTKPEVRKRIEDSVQFLNSKLHTSIYGVTTGFGGSADTRTENRKCLQTALLEHQLSGVLVLNQEEQILHPTANSENNMMPEAIVRGAILIRINSLARGHSGVRVEVLESLNKLLEYNITPCVPLRGSISASGDLQPLSYVAATIAGHPDVKVLCNIDGNRTITTAQKALKMYNMTPVEFAAKEGLGLINGTAFSASASALVLHQSSLLANLSQKLTGLTVEALIGQVGSFDEFIHNNTRPHEGQIQCAKNMREMLEGSKLAVFDEDELSPEQDKYVLRQDRYPLRTSAQWIGPNLESLELSLKQVSVELNSTTDNPLLDSEQKKIHHGGNFQACSPAKAMDTTRLCLQQLGKLSFSQVTEMMNCNMNRGLPSCLAGSDPSTNFHCKGLDINAAAYTSELGFLANPVTPHVQSAEMHNQAVNSLALISARKSMEAVDVLSMLFALHLYASCQAIDLRVVDSKFRVALDDVLAKTLKEHNLIGQDASKTNGLLKSVSSKIGLRLEQNASMDAQDRFNDAIDFVTSSIVEHVVSTNAKDVEALSNIQGWKKATAFELTQLYRSTQGLLNDISGTTLGMLGNGTGKLYKFVRETLGIKTRLGDVSAGRHQHTVGSDVSKIHEAIRSGRISEAL